MAGATSPASIIFFPPRIVAEMRPSQRGFGPRLDRGGPSATASGGCHRPPWAMSALREGVSVESQSAAPTAHQGRANWVFYMRAVRAFGRYRETLEKITVNRHRGEPGHTRDTRTHGSQNLTSAIQTHQRTTPETTRKNNGNSPYDVHCGASLPETLVVSRLPPVSFYANTGPLLLSGEAAAQGCAA